MKNKRKNPCWNCDVGEGYHDSILSDGSPFEFLKCDWCGAWWDNPEWKMFPDGSGYRFHGFRIKPGAMDDFQRVNNEAGELRYAVVDMIVTAISPLVTVLNDIADKIVDIVNKE